MNNLPSMLAKLKGVITRGLYAAVFGTFGLIGLLAGNQAQAGILASTGIHWCNFAFRPDGDGSTANYYGYGAQAHLGYSIAKVFDVAGFGFYTPGSTKTARGFTGDAVLMFYGGELALRLGKTFYLAGRAGTASYSLKEALHDNQVEGEWGATGGGLGLGVFIPFNKSHNWQANVNFMHAVMSRTDVESETEQLKTLGAFSLSIAYIYNGHNNGGGGGSAIGDFMGSMFN